MADLDVFLKPTEFMDFHRERVKNKAHEITEGLKSDVLYF